MTGRSLIVGLASPRVASSLDEALENVRRLVGEASSRGAEIVCFPEACVPGLRGQDFEVPPFGAGDEERALRAVAVWSKSYGIATILGMERHVEGSRQRQIVSWVVDGSGEIQGFQTKNQIDPSEDRFYVPGDTRTMFEVRGVKFGVAICHEGWRYPEAVRWAAVRGAAIVFHPQHTGAQREGSIRAEWGGPGPYYERAMMCRALENTIYFASVNTALKFQESATSLIDPTGACQAFLPYGREGVLVQTIDLDRATGLLARRYAPERYREAGSVRHGEEAARDHRPVSRRAEPRETGRPREAP